MNKNVFELVIVDKRVLPEEEPPFDDSLDVCYMNNSIWKCDCSNEAKIIYMMISTFIDDRESATVLDLQNFIMSTTKKCERKIFAGKNNLIKSLNALTKCNMISYDKKYLYVY